MIRWIKKLRYQFTKSRCYTNMEKVGIATMGSCCGIVGGDKPSGYLDWECVECPYFVAGVLKEIAKNEKETLR